MSCCSWAQHVRCSKLQPLLLDMAKDVASDPSEQARFMSSCILCGCVTAWCVCVSMSTFGFYRHLLTIGIMHGCAWMHVSINADAVRPSVEANADSWRRRVTGVLCYFTLPHLASPHLISSYLIPNQSEAAVRVPWKRNRFRVRLRGGRGRGQQHCAVSDCARI